MLIQYLKRSKSNQMMNYLKRRKSNQMMKKKWILKRKPRLIGKEPIP
jgi:hypothetical protein